MIITNTYIGVPNQLYVVSPLWLVIYYLPIIISGKIHIFSKRCWTHLIGTCSNEATEMSQPNNPVLFNSYYLGRPMPAPSLNPTIPSYLTPIKNPVSSFEFHFAWAALSQQCTAKSGIIVSLYIGLSRGLSPEEILSELDCYCQPKHDYQHLCQTPKIQEGAETCLEGIVQE
jgi:hypothetical protein